MTITAEPPPVRPPRFRSMRYEPLPTEPVPAEALPTEPVPIEAVPAEALPAEALPTEPASIPTPRHRPPSSTRPSPGPIEPVSDDRLRPSVHRVLRLLLEVLDGRRPFDQLTAHLTPPALRYVRAAGHHRNGPSRLMSMHVCRPHPAAAEVAAVYRVGGRVRALAVRFERPDQEPWRCVAIRLG